MEVSKTWRVVLAAAAICGTSKRLCDRVVALTPGCAGGQRAAPPVGKAVQPRQEVRTTVRAICVAFSPTASIVSVVRPDHSDHFAATERLVSAWSTATTSQGEIRPKPASPRRRRRSKARISSSPAQRHRIRPQEVGDHQLFGILPAAVRTRSLTARSASTSLIPRLREVVARRRARANTASRIARSSDLAAPRATTRRSTAKSSTSRSRKPSTIWPNRSSVAHCAPLAERASSTFIARIKQRILRGSTEIHRPASARPSPARHGSSAAARGLREHHATALSVDRLPAQASTTT